MPHNQRTRTQIDEVLDLELIEQQAEHGTLDFRHYASFIVDKMAAMCAPVRDELISSLRGLTDVVTLYRCVDLYRMFMFYCRIWYRAAKQYAPLPFLDDGSWTWGHS